jgi:zinc transport system ATP-binding protein
MPQIVCENASLGYDGKPIVTDLSFTVNAGDYLCIVGENGSGKSTLMKTILNLTPPLAGSIYMEGLKPTQIGYLPQQTQVQRDFPASVLEIVLSGFQGQRGWRPFYTKEEKAAASANLKKLGLEGFERRCYRELSGGQQQRVLLARALCATQKCLLLDEPISGLDPKATAQMYEIIEQLHREGITIIMISHDVGVALADATHILHIGKHLFFGTKESYLHSGIGQAFLSEEEPK